MSEIQTAIVGVMRDIASTGIAKTQRNAQQGYNFRGIEAAMNELSPLLVKHGIMVTPSYSELSITERAKDGGKATRFCTIKGAFRFEASDGSNTTSECYGEAMDSGDKAVIKAQSVAFRNALFQQFVVPTMAVDPEAFADHEEPEIPADLLRDAREAANKGWKALAAWTKTITPEQRAILGPEIAALKLIARAADETKDPA